MLSFLKPFWLDIVKWGSIIGAGLLVFFKVRQSGRDAERVENMEKAIEKVNRAKLVRRGVTADGISPNDKLRKRWTRK